MILDLMLLAICISGFGTLWNLAIYNNETHPALQAFLYSDLCNLEGLVDV